MSILKAWLDNEPIQVDVVQFSDGAFSVTCDVNGVGKHLHVQVSPLVNASSVLMLLVLFFNTKVGAGNKRRTVYIPYLPYARADRSFSAGNANGFRTFIKSLRELCGVGSVETIDVHSTLATVIAEHIGVYLSSASSSNLLGVSGYKGKPDFVVAPDAGAVNRATAVANSYGVPVVTATKTRDPLNGRVTSTTLDAKVHGVCLIVDDICDGGGTFIPLADALRDAGASEVQLFVTHMIGSRGLNVFRGVIDKLFAYQTIGNYVTRDQLLRFNEGTYRV